MSGSHSQHSNGIHFLKVIHERTLQRRKLRVPTSFVKRYWEGISNPVTVKLPNKTEWKINWKKIDGDIWFCNNGWKEFTKHVSLSKLQYLVFQYEGNSCFNVNVLGKNGLEIKYKENIQEEFQEIHHESSDSSSVKVFDYFRPSSSSKRSKSPIPSSDQNYKKRKINPKEKKECHVSNAETIRGKRKFKEHDSGSISHTKEVIENFHEEVKKKFCYEKDFFTCAMYKSYIERDQVVLPNEYSKQHFHKMKEQSVTLFVVDKNNKTLEWNVKLKKSYNGQFIFCSGWKKFSMDNNLGIGDVCAFVSSKTKELSFQVINNPFKDQEEEALNRPNSPLTISENPKEFVSYMKSLPPILTLPINYIRNFISENGKITTLKVGKNSWPVKVLLYEHHYCARFSQGWPKFMEDCKLKVGDSLKFLMVDEQKLEFEVTITRGSH